MLVAATVVVNDRLSACWLLASSKKEHGMRGSAVLWFGGQRIGHACQ